MEPETSKIRLEPEGQHLLIANAYLQEINRCGRTLTFIFAGKTNNLKFEIEECNIHSLSLSLLLLDSNPKIQKVTA